VLLGCISHSETREEALANVKGAAEPGLQGMEQEGGTLPKEYAVDEIEASVSCRSD